MIVIGTGMGLTMPPATEAITSALPRNSQGVASALNDVTRELGTALGVALLGAVLTAGYQASIGDRLDGVPEDAAGPAREGIATTIESASLAGPGAADVIRAAREAFVDGWQRWMWVGAAATAMLLVYLIARGPRDRTGKEQDETADDRLGGAVRGAGPVKGPAGRPAAVPSPPVSNEAAMEDTVRRRLRTLRQARGWTLDDLAGRAHVGASTISRIETGQRRLAVDQLVTLARALGVSVDDLLTDDDADDVVIRPQACGDGGAVWLLSRRDDPSGRVVAKQRLPEGSSRDPERHVHPGHDWFFVLSGKVRLVLGGREHVVAEGEAASFSTLTPHSVVGVGGPAEILTILDHHGERSHLDGA